MAAELVTTTAVGLGAEAVKALGNKLAKVIIDKPSLTTAEDALNRKMDKWKEDTYFNVSTEIALKRFPAFVDCVVRELEIPPKDQDKLKGKFAKMEFAKTSEDLFAYKPICNPTTLTPWPPSASSCILYLTPLHYLYI